MIAKHTQYNNGNASVVNLQQYLVVTCTSPDILEVLGARNPNQIELQVNTSGQVSLCSFATRFVNNLQDFPSPLWQLLNAASLLNIFVLLILGPYPNLVDKESFSIR